MPKVARIRHYAGAHHQVTAFPLIPWEISHTGLLHSSSFPSGPPLPLQLPGALTDAGTMRRRRGDRESRVTVTVSQGNHEMTKANDESRD